MDITKEIDFKTIYAASAYACRRARDLNQEVSFGFNEITLNVQPLSFGDDIATIYYLKHQIRRLRAGYKD